MIDGEHLEAGVVAEMGVVLGQGDDGALGQLADSALTGKAPIAGFDGSEGQIGA